MTHILTLIPTPGTFRLTFPPSIHSAKKRANTCGVGKINNYCEEVYKKVVNGPEDLWGEYCRLRKDVKQLVIEKKLNIWNELVEKVNRHFNENRKEFWAFVGRKSKGKKKNIASLKSDTGLALTSTRGKLEVLQRHYQLLSKMSVDGVFDSDWKE